MKPGFSPNKSFRANITLITKYLTMAIPMLTIIRFVRNLKSTYWANKHFKTLSINVHVHKK